jgi:hypothetical protein
MIPDMAFIAAYFKKAIKILILNPDDILSHFPQKE